MWRAYFPLTLFRRAPHIRIMGEEHPKRPRDLNQWAKRMIDIATGEASNAEVSSAPKRSLPKSPIKNRRPGQANKT
jgi:hypothetical protein